MYSEENTKIILEKFDLKVPVKNYYYKTLAIFYISLGLIIMSLGLFLMSTGFYVVYIQNL
jgi:hypothetical protein